MKRQKLANPGNRPSLKIRLVRYLVLAGVIALVTAITAAIIAVNFWFWVYAIRTALEG